MKYMIIAMFMFTGCASLDGMATVVGAVNEVNLDTNSRFIISTYGEIREKVRDVQEEKKLHVDLQLSETNSTLHTATGGNR